MQMTDEQVWDDLSRFALAMKRGARVIFDDGDYRPDSMSDIHSGRYTSFENIAKHGGIKDIIEPPQKNVRPLNAEEWVDFAGCIVNAKEHPWILPPDYRSTVAIDCMLEKLTCHPPGNSKDVRKLWVEE